MADFTNRDETAIRGILDDWRRALRAKDAAALLAHHAPDLLAYDLAPPLLTRGPDMQGAKAWLATWDGPIDGEVHDLDIAVGGGLAYSTSLNRMRGTKVDGTVVNLWLRATVGYRKRGGRWEVAHEHVSVPFYMDGSERAALDLKPGGGSP
jgi:ketosteroid isomerase-like protein